MNDYRALADAIAADIVAGRLRPGDRLPPQRSFALRRGVATSTASRAYGELVRRGLAVGEIGRGTFVRAAVGPVEPALAEPSGARVDLELNFPVLPEQAGLMARSLAPLLRTDAMESSLRPVGAAGTSAARAAGAELLSRAGWSPDPGDVLFAGNGRQAIAAAIAALVPPGERLGVEHLTYPVVKGIAARLGVTLVPLAMDEDGVVPDGLAGGPPLRAVYLQPALHNPLGTTMPDQRRNDVAEILRRRGIVAIEDSIYSFLREDLPPLAMLAPDHVLVVDSLSKRLAPGLTLGFVVPPRRIAADLAGAIRSGAWMASRFALDAATCWINDGTAAVVADAKRRDATARQAVASERLAGLDLRADPHAYHCWWLLPEPWRADTFVAAAGRLGIAVTPAGAFTVSAGHVPNAVRLALASPSLDVLATALEALARLARRAPEDTDLE
ncbi:MAG TPA: PLP-dependent aminotransferase family protein [Actinopolymorphaceae bacterium]|nr:PLP-dependent aminotransferase family protein [Actinopolymorphaceae bacterium]